MTTGSSLHLRILAWLLIPLFLMAVVLLFEVYASANRSTAEIRDRMLLSHALAITEQALGTQGDLVYLDFVKQTSGGSVFYKVEGRTMPSYPVIRACRRFPIRRSLGIAAPITSWPDTAAKRCGSSRCAPWWRDVCSMGG